MTHLGTPSYNPDSIKVGDYVRCHTTQHTERTK